MLENFVQKLDTDVIGKKLDSEIMGRDKPE
jgi:hypothetical protein